MCVQMLIHFAHDGFSWMVGMAVLLKELYLFFYKKQVFSLSQANIILWQADVKIFNRSEQNTEKDAWRYLEMVSSHN